MFSPLHSSSCLNRILSVVVITLWLTACGATDVQLIYSPELPVPIPIPLEISVDSSGRIQFSASTPNIPTPIGDFRIGAVVDPAKQFQKQSTLTVRVDGVDHIYDLGGKDFSINFESGYYEKIALTKDGPNILLELRRANTQAQAQPVATQPSSASQSQPPAPASRPQTQPPTSTPRPAPTAVPKCSVDVASQFRSVWERAGGVSAGCPVGSAYGKYVAYQPFQRGWMLWRGGPHSDAGGMIYVLYNSGTWEGHADQWVEGMQESGGNNPPSGLVEPIRGFGNVWRNQLGGPGAKIGWALQDEAGADGGLIQDFAGGAVIFAFPGESPVFMTNTGRWVR